MKYLLTKWHILYEGMTTVVSKFGLFQIRTQLHQATSILRISHRAFYQLLLPFYMTLFFCLCFILAVRPIHAAMVLNSFDIVVDLSTISAEWSTASEHEVLAFELYYKDSTASQSQYQLIGKQVAQGNKESGAIYRIDVTENVIPAGIYCFRLKEITLNDDRGEIIDRCGYGLQITPTANVFIDPTATITTTIAPTATETVTTELLISPTLQPQPVIATTTPIVLETNTPDNEQQLPPNDSTEIEESPTTTVDSNTESPLPTPTPQPEAQFTDGDTVAASSVSNIEITTTLSNTTVQETAGIESPLSVPSVTGITNNDNPSYIVLTVTPTSEEIVNVATFTPFPTAGIVENPNFIAATLPTTQNLMIVLLCGVFSGASGLGILGLVTTLLYMRARDTESRM